VRLRRTPMFCSLLSLKIRLPHLYSNSSLRFYRVADEESRGKCLIISITLRNSTSEVRIEVKAAPGQTVWTFRYEHSESWQTSRSVILVDLSRTATDRSKQMFATILTRFGLFLHRGSPAKPNFSLFAFFGDILGLPAGQSDNLKVKNHQKYRSNIVNCTIQVATRWL
jgi:hypothetical protein